VTIRNPLLHFYWIDFVSSLPSGDGGYGWVRAVCGVTAFTLDDALYLISTQLCVGRPLPTVRTVIEDFNPATLDPGHVRRHIGGPIFRGVWYPNIDSQGYRKGQYPEVAL